MIIRVTSDAGAGATRPPRHQVPMEGRSCWIVIPSLRLSRRESFVRGVVRRGCGCKIPEWVRSLFRVI